MKSIRFFVVLVFFPGFAFAQVLDSIWTSQGAVAAKITAVTETSIRYQFPNEEFENSIFKANVFKIKYASGRVDVFTDALTLQSVRTPWEWQKVVVTSNVNQVSGLTALGFLTSSVYGTRYSNSNKLNGKAYDKIKMETAMLGGNIFCLLNGYALTGASVISGNAYTNEPLDYTAFNHILSSGGPTFKLVSIVRLKYRRRTMKSVQDITQSSVTLSSPQTANGIIKVTATIDGVPNPTFQVTWFDDERIILSERDTRGLFSITLAR